MNFICQRRWPGIPAGLLLAGLALLWLAGAPLASAQESQPSAYQVKAAFLMNFGKFVEWPTNAFAAGQTNLIIGVFGDDPFHGDLEVLVAGQKIAGHPLAVRQIRSLADVKGCQLLFIPAEAKDQTRDVLTAVGGQAVLTVGESEGFCDAGGMINFVLVNRQVHFDINNEAAKSAGLKISSKLLMLARRLQIGS